MILTKRVLLALPFAAAAALTVLINVADRLHLRREHIAGYGFLFAAPWAWLLDRGWFGDVRSRWAQEFTAYAIILWIPALLCSGCALLGVAGVDFPAALVVLLSLIIGLLMVVVFRYTSDQKAIRLAKDQLKAHLLAVRLFQDQLPVVLSSYARILRCTGRYLRLAFKPLLFVVLPLTFLIVQLDRYLGWAPLRSGQAFLVKVHTTSPEALNEVSLLLPAEMKTTAPPVHVPVRDEVVWRVVAEKNGDYNVSIGVAGQTLSKAVVVSSGLSRISPIRLQGRFWERIFVSGELALPESSPIQSVEVGYPSRNIRFLGFEWNWIWLFFVLSLVAGFVFKSVLKIEI